MGEKKIERRGGRGWVQTERGESDPVRMGSEPRTRGQQTKKKAENCRERRDRTARTVVALAKHGGHRKKIGYHRKGWNGWGEL